MLAVRRLIAYGIDFIILAMILVSVQLIINVFTGGGLSRSLQSGWAIELWVLLTMSAPVWLYFIYCEHRTRQTIGKKMMRLMLERVDGQPLKLRQTVIRTLIKLLPWELTHIFILLPEPWWSVPEAPRISIYLPNILIVLYAVFLFWTRGKRALHDLIPGTHIVSE
ncbi:RDD family [Chlamydia abortus]|nr:RDD family [Chlamydia abortus]